MGLPPPRGSFFFRKGGEGPVSLLFLRCCQQQSSITNNFNRNAASMDASSFIQLANTNVNIGFQRQSARCVLSSHRKLVSSSWVLVLTMVGAVVAAVVAVIVSLVNYCHHDGQAKRGRVYR